MRRRGWRTLGHQRPTSPAQAARRRLRPGLGAYGRSWGCRHPVRRIPGGQPGANRTPGVSDNIWDNNWRVKAGYGLTPAGWKSAGQGPSPLVAPVPGEAFTRQSGGIKALIAHSSRPGEKGGRTGWSGRAAELGAHLLHIKSD